MTTGKMLNNYDGTYIDLDKSIQPYVRKVLENKHYGVSKEKIKMQMFEGCRNQFEMSVPFADHLFKFNVIFDLNFSDLAPDFLFENSSFLMDPNANDILKSIPSLANWDKDDPNSLMKVIEELTLLYTEHQIEMSTEFGDRIQTEYALLEEVTNKKDVEVTLTMNGKQPEAHIFVKLDLDFSGLPYRNVQDLNDMIVLTVNYHGMTWNRITEDITYTEEVKEILAKCKFNLPHVGDGEALFNYIPTVQNMLQEKIDMLIKSYRMRRDFVGVLHIFQRSSILEYNQADFSQITLLVKIKQHFYIVTIKFPDLFPEIKPEVLLQRVNSDNFRKPSTITKFKYSKDMEPFKMVSSILTFIQKTESEKIVKNEENKHSN